MSGRREGEAAGDPALTTGRSGHGGAVTRLEGARAGGFRR
jgi:hypothetical protein